MSARPTSLDIEVDPTTSDLSSKQGPMKVAVGFKSEEEESDVAKDEKKDSEKPLIDNREVILEVGQGKPKDPEIATLPLPERPSRYSKERDEPPSVFPFPCARIKYAWNHSNNLLEFLSRTVCIVFASFGWLVIVGGIPFLSLAEIIIGSKYLNDCPAQPLIPEYLIVAGVFGTILHSVAVLTKVALKEKKPEHEIWRKRCICIEACLQVFLTVWFIAGCSWVYSIYEPEYNVKHHHGYCHKVLYLFAFWMLNITFIILIFFVTMCVCCITFIAMGSNKIAE